MGESFQLFLQSARPKVAPEYDVLVDRVVLGLHPTDSDGGLPLHRIAPVIAARPKDVRIEILVPDTMMAAVRRALDAQFPGRTIAAHSTQVAIERPGATEIRHEAPALVAAPHYGRGWR